MGKVLPQIKNIVYLMLENRSLDNLLGWLYKSSSPLNFYPHDNKTEYNGLKSYKYFNPAHSIFGDKKYFITPIPSAHEGKAIPWYDPYEAMAKEFPYDTWNGVMNQLYGNANLIKGMPDTSRTPGMMGFLQDYYAREMATWQGLDITWTYTPEPKQAPIINTLAWMYGVSDSWYCSVPTQTNPNRAFSLCGTSEGNENNGLGAIDDYNIPTIFNRLAEAKDPKSWGLYYEGTWQGDKCFTDYTFPQIRKAKYGEIATMDNFFARAKAGSLPAFTFLEPKWGYGRVYNGSFFVQGNDYHPPTLIGPGEQFLFQAYAALRESPQWKDTLFFVTFDEHGGTYDHVAPPGNALNPDGKIGKDFKFNFQRYGARVPTLLISPYVPRRTLFRKKPTEHHEYDHCSFIKTLLSWAGYEPQAMNLGKRVEYAPTFEGVLSDTLVNESGVQLEEVPFERDPEEENQDIPKSSPPQGEPLNDLFGEDFPYTSARIIIQKSDTLEDIKRGIAKFRDDPAKFESTLEKGEIPSW